MTAKGEYEDKIIEILDKSSQTLEDLTRDVNVKLGKLPKYKREKQFKEAIMNLLKDGKIDFQGYNFDIHNVKEKRKNSEAIRIQADMKIEGIIFYLVKTSHTDIRLLLNQLEDSEIQKVRNAYNELKKLFYLKTTEFENKYFKMWEEEKKKVGCWVLSDKMKELKEDKEERKFYLKTLEGMSPAMHNYDSTYDLPENHFINEKGKHRIVKRFKKVNILEQIKESLDFSFMDFFIGNSLKWRDLAKKNEKAKLWFIFNEDKETFSYTEDNILIDEEGSMNEEIALIKIQKKRNPKWEPPIRRSKEEVEDIFRKILFFINIKDENNFLKTFFSLALSDDKQSLNWFGYFFKNVPQILPSFEKKLSDDLKVVPQFTYEEIEGAEEGYQAYKTVQNW